MSIAICMWSGPRNLSTAMMRSFESRADCQVWDEPFFAPFLKATGKAHPGREETLAAHDTDPNRVAQKCQASIDTPYHFQKHMPHHMIKGFPMAWTKGAKHFFLLREPRRVIASYCKGRARFDLDDLGFGPQARLYEYLTAQEGHAPPVIDSLDILNNPEKALRALCRAIDIPFDKAMLSWAAGKRATDGAWAPYWYKSVEASTGFAEAPKAECPEIPECYQDMLMKCEADYKILSKHCLRV